jgi:hypothetical protein
MASVTAAATFVQITRDELEEWLDSIGYRGKWERDIRYVGMYLIKLSDTVAVKLSSTIGSKDDAMGRGKASMQLALVSSVTGRTVNKKAQGQDHFKRTIGWKKTWATGIETMKKAYMSSSDFYDVIAGIVDRDAYKDDLLQQIKKVQGWENNPDLVGYYRKIEKGGVLMPRERGALDAEINRPATPKPPERFVAPERRQEPVRPEPQEPAQQSLPGSDKKEMRMDALRKLYVMAKRSNNDWVMNFAQDIAQKFVSQGRALSGPQIRILTEKLRNYRVMDSNGNPAQDLF